MGGLPRGAGWKCVGMKAILKRGVRRRTPHYWWSLREIRHTLIFFFPLSTHDQLPEQCFTPILASLKVSPPSVQNFFTLLKMDPPFPNHPENTFRGCKDSKCLYFLLCASWVFILRKRQDSWHFRLFWIAYGVTTQPLMWGSIFIYSDCDQIK